MVITAVDIKESNKDNMEDFNNDEKQMILTHLQKFNIPYQLSDFKNIRKKTMDKLENFWEKDISVGLKLRFWYIAKQLQMTSGEKNAIEKIATDSNIFTKGNNF